VLDITVLHGDLIAPVPGLKGKWCNKQGRAFFVRHGLDWAEFVRNGLPAAVIEATNDARAFIVVEAARRRLQAN